LNILGKNASFHNVATCPLGFTFVAMRIVSQDYIMRDNYGDRFFPFNCKKEQYDMVDFSEGNIVRNC